MDFYLFLLVNVALFLRPQDLIRPLADVQFYNILIVANLVIAAPGIIRQLRGGYLQAPATLCIAGILGALVLSLAARGDLGGAMYWGLEFVKVAAYFILMTAVLRTPRRLTIFMATFVLLTTILAGLAVAHFHGQIELPAISHARETVYEGRYGERIDSYRLAAFGVFADPNDLSMIVVMSMLICAGGMFCRKLGVARWGLALPLLFLAYTLSLTQSRGGLLALLAGVSAYSINRFGWARSGLAIAFAIPILFSVYEGRQSDFSTGISKGTGSQRTDLWYAGLQMLQWSPIWGIGHGQFVQEEGLVAHNSYLQALTEWGLLGGTMFIGLFYVVIHSVWRLKSVRRQIASPILRNMQPYVLGALAAYAASMLTLTRCDVVPTYLVAGLGVSFERLARHGTSLKPLKASPALLGRMALLSLGFIALLYVYIRFIYRLYL